MQFANLAICGALVALGAEANWTGGDSGHGPPDHGHYQPPHNHYPPNHGHGGHLQVKHYRAPIYKIPYIPDRLRYTAFGICEFELTEADADIGFI